MTAQSSDPKQIKLASGFTVADYESAKAQDRDKVADALRRRFVERYIDPVTPHKNKQMHGFTMMAVSCLMIEAFEAFAQGWKDSKGKSERAFCLFFASNNQFVGFRGYSAPFYKNVRCGILHQAETTGGWKITRRSNARLFDPSPLPTVNATLFLQQLRVVIDGFCNRLKTVDWNSSEEWRNVHTKMKELCKNCGP